jgi:hypothetical protein
MNPEQPAEPAPGESPGAPASSPSPVKGKADRYVKLVFLVAFLAVVGWLIARQYFGTSLPGWSGDLEAALKDAAVENRKIVALTYDSPNDFDYEKLRIVVDKKANREAMEAAKVIRVHCRMSKTDPMAVKYKISRFPATLLIAPNGDLITRWEGYIGEVAFRKEFLQGKAQQ